MRILLGSPCYAGVAPDTVIAVMATADALRDAGHEVLTPVRFATKQPHSPARATLLLHLLRSDADALLTFDSGISWDPSEILPALELVEHHGAHVVSWATPTATGAANVALDREQCDAKRLRGVRIGAAKFLRGRHLAGMALTMVTRTCARRLVEAYPGDVARGGPGCADGLPVGLFAMGTVADGEAWGEDFFFCSRWLDLGEEIHVCASSRVMHDGRAADLDAAILDCGFGIEFQDGTEERIADLTAARARTVERYRGRIEEELSRTLQARRPLRAPKRQGT